jgi:uncharacterized membrane protein YbjE (DUF340 family)
MKGSIIIVSFFAIGCLFGYFELLNIDFQTYPITKYVLFLLMFCVGLGLGADTNLVKQLKGLNWRFALLPIMTAVGTLAGALIAWIICNHYLLSDYFAVGSGFAYYSLSSIFISEMRGAELGTIALIANVLREILAMLFIPIVSKKFGPLAAISMGGATTFDSTFPIISQSVEKKYLIVSIFHGSMLDVSVPFLVTLFCNI